MLRQGWMFKRFIGEMLVKDKGEIAVIGSVSLQTWCMSVTRVNRKARKKG